MEIFFFFNNWEQKDKHLAGLKTLPFIRPNQKLQIQKHAMPILFFSARSLKSETLFWQRGSVPKKTFGDSPYKYGES